MRLYWGCVYFWGGWKNKIQLSTLPTEICHVDPRKLLFVHTRWKSFLFIFIFNFYSDRFNASGIMDLEHNAWYRETQNNTRINFTANFEHIIRVKTRTQSHTHKKDSDQSAVTRVPRTQYK